MPSLLDYKGPKVLQDVTFTLLNGELKALTGVGLLFYVVEATGDLSIKTDKSSENTFSGRQGLQADPSSLFERLEITNRSGATVTARVIYGFGGFQDGTSEVTGTVAVSSLPPVSLGASISATEQTVTQLAKNVAVAGTAERLSAADVFCETVKIKAKTANTGLIKFGYAGGAGLQLWELVATEWIQLNAPNGKRINLKNIWIDSAVNGEGVIFEGQS